MIGTYFSNKIFSELEFLDITLKEKVDEFILKKKPEIIIHVAANADGHLCETDPSRAIDINEHGTEYIKESANKVKSKIIFISSYAAKNNNFLYGRTKHVGEEIVKQTKAGYVIIRPSLILGISPNTSNNRDFNNLLKNITEKSYPSYDCSWKFQPTWLRHLFEVIQQVIEREIYGEMIPVAVPEIKSKYDVAYDILSNFEIFPEKQDFHDSAISIHNLDKLSELNFPTYDYEEIISGIVEEIKEHLSKN